MNGQNSAARVGQYFLLFCFSIAEMSGKRSSLIEFKRIGIGPKNGENTAGWKLKTLGTLIHEEGLEDVSSRHSSVRKDCTKVHIKMYKKLM